MNLREIGWDDMDWINLAQGSKDCLEILEWPSDWRLLEKGSAS
jgi:hypothetical protein